MAEKYFEFRHLARYSIYPQAIARYPLEWYKKNFDSIFEEFPKFGDESWDKSAQHSLLNLVSHEDRIKPGRLWSFLISAVCHVRALQVGNVSNILYEIFLRLDILLVSLLFSDFRLLRECEGEGNTRDDG